MPQDLPGFYYDKEKNRYFPTKGPIPGSSSKSAAARTTTTDTKPKICKPATTTQRLLQARECSGSIFPLNRRLSKFDDEFRNVLASRPSIWRYKTTENMAYTALQSMCFDVTTRKGVITTDGLLAGAVNGSFSFFEVGKVGQQFDNGVKYVPDHVWPLTKEIDEFNKPPGHLWMPRGASVQLASDISSIKLLEIEGVILKDKLALITTLGSEKSGGCVFVLNLTEPLDPREYALTPGGRMHKIASTNCTIWTADCTCNGSQVVIGTNLGAALVNLETRSLSWICRSKSDVLAQQIDQAGNVVICGFRNGAILTVDVREKQQGSSSRLVRCQLPLSRPDTKGGSTCKQWFKLFGRVDTSRSTYMPKSIASLVSLKLYDQYFLASSMDGLIKLYDHRLTKRGPVQCYMGQVNSHTRIQLGVDPLEKFVMSGGEDCYLRLWNIKSGQLLFAEKFCPSVPLTLCCQSQKYAANRSEQSDSWGSWVGSRDGLYYMQFS